MKKTTLLLALITLGFAGLCQAQSGGAPMTSTKSNNDAPFGGPLADRRPTPASSAAPAKDNGGKKMVGEVTLATDEKGKNTTMSFPAGTSTIYMLTKNVSGAKGDKVRVDWVADDAGKPMVKGKRFYNSAVELPDTMAHNPNFHVTGPGNKAFPAGKYHADLFVGDEKFKSVKFSVM